jgi:hypothetical protein
MEAVLLASTSVTLDAGYLVGAMVSEEAEQVTQPIDGQFHRPAATTVQVQLGKAPTVQLPVPASSRKPASHLRGVLAKRQVWRAWPMVGITLQVLDEDFSASPLQTRVQIQLECRGEIVTAHCETDELTTGGLCATSVQVPDSYFQERAVDEPDPTAVVTARIVPLGSGMPETFAFEQIGVVMVRLERSLPLVEPNTLLLEVPARPLEKSLDVHVSAFTPFPLDTVMIELETNSSILISDIQPVNSSLWAIITENTGSFWSIFAQWRDPTLERVIGRPETLLVVTLGPGPKAVDGAEYILQCRVKELRNIKGENLIIQVRFCAKTRKKKGKQKKKESQSMQPKK